MNNLYYLVTSNLPIYIYFSSYPEFGYVGLSTEPFTIFISAFDNNPHIVHLYAFNSNSYPVKKKNKWSHLLPQWRFVDLSGNYIESIQTKDTLVTFSNGTTGVTGYATFYYVDDMPGEFCSPVFLIATLETSGYAFPKDQYENMDIYPSYANSKISTVIPYIVNPLKPKGLMITKNGIESFKNSVFWDSGNIFNIIHVYGSIAGNTSNYNLTSNLIFSYPQSNQLGFLAGSISRKIVGLSDDDQTWFSIENNSISANFRKYNDDGFIIAGFNRNFVTPYLTSNNVYISAGVNVIYNLQNFNIPSFWVSNPNNNHIHKIYYPCIDQTIYKKLTSWIDKNQINVHYLKNILTPKIETVDQYYNLSGFGGIYGIALDLLGGFWATDSEMDRIYQFDSNGNILKTIYLSSYNIHGTTPAGISLDEYKNVYVSLFDSLCVLKFDYNGNLLHVIKQPEIFDTQNNYIYKSTIVEPDQENNVWVLYNTNVNSCIYKYNSNGEFLLSIFLPLCSEPYDSVIDYENNLWVTLAHHSGPPYLSGGIWAFDKFGNRVSAISAVHPEYITMDLSGNIWFTEKFNIVTCLNRTTNTLQSFQIGPPFNYIWYNQNERLEFNALEGIACDTYNRIWVLDSLNNEIYLIKDNIPIKMFKILPDNNLVWYSDNTFESSIYGKSLQAYGDWTGLKWIQKYYYKISPYELYYDYITGKSEPFVIDSFKNYDFRKFNESWSGSDQMRDYALSDHIYENYNLFKIYINSMLGDVASNNNTLGRYIYEKIANFVQNTVDIETCNIDQLYSICKMLDVPIDDYNFKYPSDLKRLMDILSIHFKKLYGVRCKCNFNFTLDEYCKNCGHSHKVNIGNELDISTYIVTANVPFLAQYKYYPKNFRIIYPSESFVSIYNVVSNYLINNPEDYTYYEYITSYCNKQCEGVINWDDKYTLLSESISSIDEWYKDYGIVDKILTYQLYKGLGFISNENINKI